MIPVPWPTCESEDEKGREWGMTKPTGLDTSGPPTCGRGVRQEDVVRFGYKLPLVLIPVQRSATPVVGLDPVVQLVLIPVEPSGALTLM